MGWDAAFVGEIRIDPARFSELESGACEATPIEGLRALSQEPLATGTFAGLLAALVSGASGASGAGEGGKSERLLTIDRKPRKGTLGLLGALDEDAFRAHLPALTQLFARAASLGAAGELVLFGLESDEDLAHELVIDPAGARALVRPLAKRAKLDKLRAKVGLKLAMRLPPMVEAVAADAPRALHPGWAKRKLFGELSVAYRHDAKKTDLVVDVRSERAQGGNAVLLALRSFEEGANAGLFGPRGWAKLVEEPKPNSKRARGVVAVKAIEPLALRVLVEDLANQLTLDRNEPVALTISNGDGPADVDTATMSLWLADPAAFPCGSSAIGVPVEDLAPLAKGALWHFDTDVAPHDDKVLCAIYAVTAALGTTPDPHGAVRKALVPPLFARTDMPRIKKGKKGGVDVAFGEWSADRALARGLVLAAVERLNELGKTIRGVSLALPT